MLSVFLIGFWQGKKIREERTMKPKKKTFNYTNNPELISKYPLQLQLVTIINFESLKLQPPVKDKYNIKNLSLHFM